MAASKLCQGELATGRLLTLSGGTGALTLAASGADLYISSVILPCAAKIRAVEVVASLGAGAKSITNTSGTMDFDVFAGTTSIVLARITPADGALSTVRMAFTVADPEKDYPEGTVVSLVCDGDNAADAIGPTTLNVFILPLYGA